MDSQQHWKPTMKMALRVLTVLVALQFGGFGIWWIVDPTAAAAELGMELLTGMGASTQIGDIGAFFLAMSAMIVLGQRQGQAHWFYPAAMLVGFAAATRTLAFLTGNAPFGLEFIAPEVIMAAILVAAARTRSREDAEEMNHA
jgi:hypothetical protein